MKEDLARGQRGSWRGRKVPFFTFVKLTVVSFWISLYSVCFWVLRQAAHIANEESDRVAWMKFRRNENGVAVLEGHFKLLSDDSPHPGLSLYHHPGDPECRHPFPWFTSSFGWSEPFSGAVSF